MELPTREELRRMLDIIKDLDRFTDPGLDYAQIDPEFYAHIKAHNEAVDAVRAHFEPLIRAYLALTECPECKGSGKYGGSIAPDEPCFRRNGTGAIDPDKRGPTEEYWELHFVECGNCGVQILTRGGSLPNKSGLSDNEGGEDEALCGGCAGVELSHADEISDGKDQELAELRTLAKPLCDAVREHSIPITRAAVNGPLKALEEKLK